MQRAIILALSFLLSGCGDAWQPVHKDTVITCELRDDGSTDELCSALYQAIEAWQPAVPYRLSVSHSAWQGDTWRVVATSRSDPSGQSTADGTPMCDRNSKGTRLGAAYPDDHTIRICDELKPGKRLVKTVVHELGHVLGLDHEGEGVMTGMNHLPTPDDLALMRALYE